MISNNTQHVFDATAESYDRNRARLIPGYDAFYGAAIALLPAPAVRIVDLGAGSGILTSFVLQALPAAHIHLVDFSSAMLSLARQRLGSDQRLTFEVADYSSSPLPDGVDCVISALSIHHLEDEAKRELFRNICSALNPGGLFINADQVLQPNAQLEAQAKEQWLADVRRAGASERQIADSLLRQQEDRCATVEAQLEWMREAGFAEPQCRYRHSRFAVLAAHRPAK